MKSVTCFLLCLLILSASSIACHAQFELNCPVQTIAGEPNSLYQINPGQQASVTVAENCTFTCKNDFSNTHTAYLYYYLAVGIVYADTQINHYNASPVLQPGQMWSDTESASLTQNLSPGSSGSTEYTAIRNSYITEDKTGDSNSDSEPMYVTVQYFS